MKNIATAFTQNLGKVYGLFTVGFLLFVLALAMLEQLGLSTKIIGYLFFGLPLLVYVLIGIVFKTKWLKDYYVAGCTVPPIFNGMATGAGWMSGASFMGLAGSLYILGYDGLAFVLGWTGGFVLIAVLLAPYLRKLGVYTVPDFLATRYGSHTVRFIGVVVLLSCSFIYLTAQIYAIGIISARFLNIPFEIALLVGLVGIVLCSLFGGMQSITWTQVAQYIVLLCAYLIPIVILSVKVTGIPIPQLAYGSILEKIATLETELNIATAHVQPFIHYNPLNYFLLVACLMLGTASLPHILMRYFTTPKIKDARQSVAWSLLFIVMLYLTAPAYAAFAKYEIYSNLIGQNINSLPDWVDTWAGIGDLLKIEDVNQDGILQFNEFKIGQDLIMLATPEIAGLPFAVVGLVAVGGFAAALSTVNGLLLAIASTLSVDLHYKMAAPKASPKKRLFIARIILLLVVILATWLASTQPSDILTMVAWAFSIAASGLFVPLVLGVWWRKTTDRGAIAGMLSGYLVCLWYLAVTRYFPEIGVEFFAMSINDAARGIAANNVGYFGIINLSAAALGVPVSLIVTILVSLFTETPSEKTQALISSIRVPRNH